MAIAENEAKPREREEGYNPNPKNPITVWLRSILVGFSSASDVSTLHEATQALEGEGYGDVTDIVTSLTQGILEKKELVDLLIKAGLGKGHIGKLLSDLDSRKTVSAPSASASTSASSSSSSSSISPSSSGFVVAGAAIQEVRPLRVAQVDSDCNSGPGLGDASTLGIYEGYFFFKGFDGRHERHEVVIKTTESRGGHDPGALDREFEILQSLKGSDDRYYYPVSPVPYHLQPGQYMVVGKFGTDLRSVLGDRLLANEYALGKLVSTVNHLHGLGFVHLDIKPQNIVCSMYSTLQFKLIDFESARKVGEIFTPDTISPGYVSPEVYAAHHSLRSSNPSVRTSLKAQFASDIFSLALSIALVLDDSPGGRGPNSDWTMLPASDPSKLAACLTDFSKLDQLVKCGRRTSLRPSVMSMLALAPSERASLDSVIKRLDYTLTAAARDLDAATERAHYLEDEISARLDRLGLALQQGFSSFTVHISQVLSEHRDELFDRLDNSDMLEELSAQTKRISGAIALAKSPSDAQGYLDEFQRGVGETIQKAMTLVAEEQRQGLQRLTGNSLTN